MTHPTPRAPEVNTATTVQIDLSGIPEGAAAIIPLSVPADAVIVRVPEGKRHLIVTKVDLTHALIVGNPIVPTWSDPAVVLATYGLGPAMRATEELLSDVFGSDAKAIPEIEMDPDSRRAGLVFRLVIGESQQDQRSGFLDRYAAEIVPPEDAPIPAIVWDYSDAS